MNPDSADALVARATEVRERLFSVIEALDRKRHAVGAPLTMVQTLTGTRLRPVFFAGGAVAALVAGVGFAVASRHRRIRRARQTALMKQVGFALSVLLVAEVGRAALRGLTSRRRSAP